MTTGFNNQVYIQKQTEHIKERINQFGNKLYLEFGGKLFDDLHAARVLPGFDANGKIRLLQEFKDMAEIILCINAKDIEKNKVRADIGITYDMECCRLIDKLRERGLYINSVVITQYGGQSSADLFRKKLEMRDVKTYLHYPIAGYPANIDLIVSDEGYGKNDYVETTRPLVVVTAPGPCSGKLATCLSQLYHEYRRGINAGYAKFETFPIWNIPLKHPVNLAYESATADLKDINMIDPYHLEAYGVTTVNYNRDIEAFPVVRTILNKIMDGKDVYKSPTDMGVNMAGYAIEDDVAVRAAASQEIIRRYYKCCCDYKLGLADQETAERAELIMNQLDLKAEDRTVIAYALKKAEDTGVPSMAIALPDGAVITGKTSTLMTAASSVLMNSLKHLAGFSDDLLLLAPVVLEPIMALKRDLFQYKNPVLSLEEILIALSVCAATSSFAQKALSFLHDLKGCEAHSSCMLTSSEEQFIKNLGINLTCEPEFPSNDLYFG